MRHLRRIATFVLVFLVAPDHPLFSGDGRVLPGIDVLQRRQFSILQGNRVGLITNPTGITADLQSTIDVLASAPGVKLVALFGPEHGVRGDIEAGKKVETYVDQRTGIPVYSLYGRTRKPTPEMLRGIDVLVYDIQDIGVRSYTYISTMGLAMEAAAENGLEFLVLDRPNPLTGNRVEGSVLDTAFRSFIGMYPIPYVYGMTAGELAHMINGEGWLNGGRTCRLTVVPLEGWSRNMWWDETGLFWVLPSPHIPRWNTSLFYVMTGLLGELGTANQGVGYTLPFELVGAPWVDRFRLAEYLNGLNLEGILFRPMTYKAFYFDTSNTQMEGVQLHITDYERLNMIAVQLSVIEALLRLFPERNIIERAKGNGRTASFDRANGTDVIRIMFEGGASALEVLRWADQQRAQFMIKREKYLLYE